MAPLKEVYSSFRGISTWQIGFESQTVYKLTPQRYEVDNTDIYNPHYIGESKKTRWLAGNVYLDVLAKKYPEDEFLRRCLDPKLRFEDSEKVFEFGETKGILTPKTEMQRARFLKQKIAIFYMGEDGREQILVRILTPAKIKTRLKRVGFLKLKDEHYIVPP